MVKKFLASAFSVLLIVLYLPPLVFAEQPSAGQYRQLISSGNFYIEYSPQGDFSKRKVTFTTVGLAISGNKKMVYSSSYGVKSALAYIPIIGLFSGGNAPKLHRTYYYDGANYYEIKSKKEIVKSNPVQLQDKYINPQDALVKSVIENYTKTLDTLTKILSGSGVSFLGSGQLAFDDKGKVVMNYDWYVQSIQNAEGGSQLKNFYFVYYDEKGELAGLDQLTVRQNIDGVDAKVLRNNVQGRIVFNKIASDLPQDAFTLPAEATVYEPYLGDMNELVERRVPAEN